jgi:hypothetical protein
MKLIKVLFVMIVLTVVAVNSEGQRKKYVSDSTVYGITPDDTIVAGRQILYRKNGNTLSAIRDFSINFPDTSYFIRDFDFWDEHNWYLLYGSKWYSGSELYKSTDAGASWQSDTSYYSVSEAKSLNQVQIVDRKRAFLFDNYYLSNVYRTFDGGVSWEKWVTSFAQNHMGIFVCNDSTYYLWGTYGDGFPNYMFPIPRWLSGSVFTWTRCNRDSGCVILPESFGSQVEDTFRVVFETIKCPDPQTHVYTFTGNGNWDVPANWMHNRVPPFQLLKNNSIVIDHDHPGNCTLNVTQVINPGAAVEIRNGKNLTVPEKLIIRQ